MPKRKRKRDPHARALGSKLFRPRTTPTRKEREIAALMRQWRQLKKELEA